MSKGTPSMGKRQKSTHIRCRRWGVILIISRRDNVQVVVTELLQNEEVQME